MFMFSQGSQGFPLGVGAVSEQSPKPSKEISEIWERPAPLSHHHENPPPFPAPKPKKVIGPHGPPPPCKPPSLATPWTEGDDQPRPEAWAMRHDACDAVVVNLGGHVENRHKSRETKTMLCQVQTEGRVVEFKCTTETEETV